MSEVQSRAATPALRTPQKLALRTAPRTPNRTPVKPEASTPTSKTETPKKKTPKKDTKSGLKWFKKSHKKSTMKRLLKSAQREASPTMVSPIPPRVVEFEIEGSSERLGVLEPMKIIDKCPGYELDFPSTPSLDWQDDSTNTSFPSSPLPAAGLLSKKVKAGKGKGKLKPKSSGSQKKGPRVTNGDLAATPQNSNDSAPGTSQGAISSLHSKLPDAQFRIMEDFKQELAPDRPNAYIRFMETPHEELADEIEYDLDEEDCAWLELANSKRKQQKYVAVEAESMEFLMDRLEKESHFQMQSTGMDHSPPIDDDAVCCICMDGECQNSNAILFCDMCNLAVHQECYGVPYIPEGQWLCRRCLQSPSRGVDCVLCPNKCGAFKQTDDGRWAHVVCALWIPEVCFSNPVFLEPVDSVNNIPPARWRLTCFICKQKGVGACIQCYKSNCYVAFHVTCAQQANLCMKMDTVRDSSSVIVKKTAYCDNHAPPELLLERKRKEGTADDSSPRQKMKQTRKLLAEKRDAIPLVSIPTIPSERVDEIAMNVTFARKRQFMKRLMAYWKLKRQTRNGVPLLRRLQASSSLSTAGSSKHTIDVPSDTTEAEASYNYYKYWLRLRQDLERVRLLCELIRKREKVKRELIRIKHRECDLSLRPLNVIFLEVLDEIRTRDPQDIFFDPVDTTEVPDYLTIVTQPMDISTMRDKVNSYQYNSIDDLEKDFDLMINNCLSYNLKDTVFYKAAVRLREAGGIIIRHARRKIESIGFDDHGLHLPKRPFIQEELTDEQILEDIDELLEDEDRFNLPPDDHINKLQEILDKSLSLTHALTRKKKVNRIKQEIFRIRRLKSVKESSGVTPKKYKSALSSATKKPNMNLSCVNLSDDSESDDSRPSPPKRRSLKADLNSRTPHRRPLRLSTRTAPVKSGRELRPLKRNILNPIPEEPTVSPPKLRVRSFKSPSTPTNNARASPASRETRVLRRNSSSVNINTSTPVFTGVVPGKPLFTTIPDPVEYPEVKTTVAGYGAWKRSDSEESLSPPAPPRISSTRTAPKSAKSKQTLRRARSVENLEKDNSTPSKPSNAGNTPVSRKSLVPRQTPVPASISPKKTRARTSVTPAATSSQKKNQNLNSKPTPPKSVGLKKIAQNVERQKSSTRSPSPRRSVKPYAQHEDSPQSSWIHQTAMQTVANIHEGVKAVRNLETLPIAKKSKPSVRNDSPKRNSRTSSTKSNVSISPVNNNKDKPAAGRSKSPRRSLAPALAKIQAQSGAGGGSGSDYEPWVPELSTCPHAHVNNNEEPPSSTSTNHVRKQASSKKKKDPVGNSRNSQSNSRALLHADSFMIYRSGGDGVNSNSNSEAEDEEEKYISAEVSSNSESDSSSSSASEDEEILNDKSGSGIDHSDVELQPMEASPLHYSSEEAEEEDPKQSSDSSSSTSSSESSSTSSSSSSSSSSSPSSSDGEEKKKKKFRKTAVPRDRRNGNSSGKEQERAVVRQVPTPRRKRQTPPARASSSPDVRRPYQHSVQLQPLIFGQERLDDSDDGEVRPYHFNREGYQPKIMDLVWARVKDSTWYPAVVCRPSANNGWSKNGVTVPGPSEEVLALKPKDSAEETFLVLFFDALRNWEWVEASSLEPLGVNATMDREHLNSSTSSEAEKKMMRKAYERAILHKETSICAASDPLLPLPSGSMN